MAEVFLNEDQLVMDLNSVQCQTCNVCACGVEKGKGERRHGKNQGIYAGKYGGDL